MSINNNDGGEKVENRVAEALVNAPSLINEDESLDALSPKNWTLITKHLLFVALMSSSVLADDGMTWGATLITPQALEWDIPVTVSATSMNYGILLQGFGGMCAVPLIEAYGRLPIWFWSQIITLGTVIGCCYAQTFGTFTALRSLQGVFGTVPQVVGLSIIHDMHYHRDWPRMINIWGTTFLVGPFLGPALAGYILDGTGWRGFFKVLAGLYGLSSTFILAFGRETYYSSGHVTQESSHLKSFFGVGNTNVPKGATLAASSKELILLIFRLPILLVGIATMVNFTWPIGITTTIDSFIRAPPYLFNNAQAASIRFAGVCGGLCGFILGYFFNKSILASHSSNWRPHYRSHGVWIPIASMAVGLVIYGLTLDFQKSVVGLVFGWILVNIGMIGSTVAITAFALELIPEDSTGVSAIINMWRTCGGFAVSYFQPAWIAKNGVGLVFGIQAVVVSVIIVITIVPVLLLGRKWVCAC